MYKNTRFCKSKEDIKISFVNTNFKFHSQNKIYASGIRLGIFRCIKTVFSKFCIVIKKYICSIICFFWESSKCLP